MSLLGERAAKEEEVVACRKLKTQNPKTQRPPGTAAAAGQSSGQSSAKSGAETSASSGSRSSNTSGAPPGDAIAALRLEHREVEALFERYRKAGAREKETIIDKLCNALSLHMTLEEELLYPACEPSNGDGVDESQVQHDCAKLLIAELRMMDGSDPYLDAKVKVLGEEIRHHIQEEEEPLDGVFAKALKAGVNTPELAQQISERKQELQDMQFVEPPPPASLCMVGVKRNPRQEKSKMNQQYGSQSRDEYGRFVSEHDEEPSYREGRGRGGYGGYGGGRSGGYRDEDEDGGGRQRMSRGRGEYGERDEEGGRGYGRGAYGGRASGYSGSSGSGGGSRGYSGSSEYGGSNRGGGFAERYSGEGYGGRSGYGQRSSGGYSGQGPSGQGYSGQGQYGRGSSSQGYSSQGGYGGREEDEDEYRGQGGYGRERESRMYGRGYEDEEEGRGYMRR
jgi:Hemerythrin HHE cation binding domain